MTVARGLTRFVGRDTALVALVQARAGHGQVLSLDAALQDTIPALLYFLDALSEDKELA